MDKCRWINAVERWFDGETSDAEPVMAHVAACPVCAAHLAQLQTLRRGVAALVTHEEIADAQFPAFVTGIRQGLERPPYYRRFWTFASVTAAALIVAVSALLMFTGGSKTVDATVVESCSTEVAGATVTSYASENGVTTVRVEMSQDDLW